MKKTINVKGVITPDEFASDFLEMDQPTYSFNDLVKDLEGVTDATIVIDSIGGMVEEGLKMYDYIKGKGFTTIAIEASSIASILFLAGQKRLLADNAKIMIHKAWIKGQEIANTILNSDTIEELRKDFEAIDTQLVGIYNEVTGTEETKLLALMSQETDIAGQALELGFATGKYEEKSLASSTANNQLIMFNLKSKNMSNQNEERLSAIEGMLRKLKNFVSGSVKNMVVDLEDGTQVFVFSEDGEIEGKRAVIAEDGEPTETNAPQGTHKLSDGREIVVGEGGIVEAVREAVDNDALAAEMEKIEGEKAAMEEEKKAMEEEIKALKATNAKALEDAEAEKVELQKQFKALSEEVETLKATVIAEPKEDKPFKALDISNEDFDKLSIVERTRVQAMAKAQMLSK